MKRKLTVLIVTYNSDDTIEPNLISLKEGYDSDLLAVKVIDNGSQDSTCKIVRDIFPWVELIESGENLGYGRGLNLGLASTETPYVLFMNPDAIFPSDEIKTLLDFIEKNEKIGMVGPSIARSNGSFQEAGLFLKPMDILNRVINHEKGFRSKRSIFPDETPFRTNWLCGAIMLCPTELLKELKGFDPRFFLYFEETDLCLRIQKKGYELWAVGQSKATHASNASARKVDPSLNSGGCLKQHYYQSRYYFMKKNFGIFKAFLTEAAELAILFTKDLFKKLTGKKTGDFKKRIAEPMFSYPPKIGD